MPTLGVNEQTNISCDLGTETVLGSWDQELFDLVGANADVLVVCPWDGIEMPLGLAMWEIPIQFLPENLDLLIAEVQQMLADRVEKVDDQEEEAEDMTEAPKPKEESSAARVESKKTVIAKVKAQAEVETETEVEAEIDTEDTTVEDAPPAPKPEMITINDEVKEPEYVVNDNAADPLELEEITIESTQSTAEPMTSKTPETTMEVIAPEIPEAPEMNTDLDERTLDETIDEIIKDDLEDTPETIITSQFEEAVEETAEPEQSQEIDTEAEMIEETIDLITEEFEIIDQIVDLPAKLERIDIEDDASEAEALEELGELFTELLTKLEIDHTPEMIKALARYRLRMYLIERDGLKAESATIDDEETPTTHDSIKKQVAVLVNLKKALVHAYAIGRSTMQLYKLSFSATKQL